MRTSQAIEALYHALRRRKLDDLVTTRIVRAELIEAGDIAPDAPDDCREFEALRAEFADRFPTEESWLSAHQELFRLNQAALDCYQMPGELEKRCPGYSPELYDRVRSDTAFAMR